jgi:hypothetical protein
VDASLKKTSANAPAPMATALPIAAHIQSLMRQHYAHDDIQVPLCVATLHHSASSFMITL